VPSGRYSTPRLSPDGKRLVLSVTQGGGGDDIVVYDFQRQTTTRLTFTHNNRNPVWTPDGKHVVFATESSRSLAIRWARADGAGEPRTLVEDKNEVLPYSFSPDGHLAYTWLTLDGGYDIWTLSLDMRDPDNPKAGAPQPFLRTRFDEMAPMFSPDGRWIAYLSHEPNASGIYVRAFPPRAGADSPKWQISPDGAFPVWSRTGRQLFYLDNDQVMAVDYSEGGDSFVAGKPRPWSKRKLPERYGACCSQWYMDPSADGNRFLIFPLRVAARPAEAFVLLNFFGELRRRLP
jgi:Tol biopolymer transport system component